MNIRTCVANVYNRPDMVAYYEHLAQYSGLWEEEYDLIKQYLNPSGTLLVVGCGTGREVFPLRAEEEHIAGMDLARQPLLIAEKKRKVLQAANISFFQGDAVSLPYRDDAFHNVLMLAQIIQHIPYRRNRRQALCETRRVLHPGGYCILSAFNKPISLVYLLLMGRQFQSMIRERKGKSAPRQKSQRTLHIFEKIARKMRPVVRQYSTPLPAWLTVIFSLYCALLNSQRTVRAVLSRHPEHIPEPNDFMIDHADFRFRIVPRKGDLFAHFPDVDEILEDVQAAGLELVDYRSLEELQQKRAFPEKERRASRLIFYVVRRVS